MTRTTSQQVLTLASILARCRICGDCWEYLTDATTEHHRRHPQVKHNGKPILVRRLAYEFQRGTLRDGFKVLPSCGNPYCINPDHQRAMTESQKSKLSAQQGAFSSPVRCKKIAEAKRQRDAKLTMEQAREIRSSEESGPVLSQRYGVDKSLVNAIKRGDSWKDYSSPFAGMGARHA